MHLKYVTITGISESCNMQSLIDLQKQYTFLEYGVLVSRSSFGKNQYPAPGWVEELAGTARGKVEEFKLSYHLCGGLAYDFLKDKFIADDLLMEIPNLAYAQRIQINFDASRTVLGSESLQYRLQTTRTSHQAMNGGNFQYIIQYNNVNKNVWFEFVKMGVYPQVLFDMSLGRGIAFDTPQKPISGLLCGYAGSLGPDNIKQKLRDIEEVVGDGICWIDMQSRVRDSEDRLDLGKVVVVLEACKELAL
jgi:hypothetical protein